MRLLLDAAGVDAYQENIMVALMDARTLYVDTLPGVWNPVQRERSEEEQAQELEQQAEASLLWNATFQKRFYGFS